MQRPLRPRNPRFNVNEIDEHGNTLLSIAAQNGHLRICQLLIRKGAYVDHQNHQGQTPMQYAMAYDYDDLGQWLADPEGGGANDLLTNAEGVSPYDGLSATGAE